MITYYLHWQKLLSRYREFFYILCAFNRRNELIRLVKWARQKRLSRPIRLYQNRLANQEKWLFRYALDSPRLTKFAKFLFQSHRLINPPPRYFPRGSAAEYRTNYLTQAAYKS